VADALTGQPVVLVANPAFAEGMSSSLRAGIAALPADVEATLVCLGDMPRVTAAHLDALIAAFDPSSDATIIVPTFQRKRGNPVLFSRRHFEEMSSLEGDVGARMLIDRHAESVRFVAVDDAGVTIDVDTPDMLEALRKG
jgi:molybdenum cofactor cytidylyltransferase